MTRRALIAGPVALISLAVMGCGNTSPATAPASRVNVDCGNKRPAIDAPVDRCSLARPLPVARKMSLAAAKAAIKFPVPQSNIAAAGPDNLTSVWANRKYQQVALVYADGDVMVTMARAAYSDPRTQFSIFLRENHASARLGSINGNVALVIPPHSDVYRSNPAWVEFDDDGIDINVASATRGTAALLEVAQSLAASPRPSGL